MTQPQIKDIFKQRYNQDKWKQFLGKTFANAQLLSTPETLAGIDVNVAAQAQKLGYIILDENGNERQIGVYEVTLAPGIILERNRVGLRNLLRKYWQNIDAAFIAYHRPESANWRFTYVSELTGYDAEGEFIKIKTEPKRYTYLLGEGESIRTAVERFERIVKKGSKATLDDVKEAFSVEKLSKTFFEEYKKHYDIFCKYMVSQPGIYQTIFNGDEKAIRDFNKKLLGRIVFLYFIQKKGWLGVPKNQSWGKGDFNFLTNHFQSFQHPELFYQDFLSVLFFDTLNTKRRDDLIKLGEGEACRIPYLNGGLFEEENKHHRNLIFTAKLFENLFNFFDQYNFTIYEDDPNDHTVAVDPEMLGHIFENLLEDNKDKGAYYTPKEIVHYMCQESLIEYLTTWFENQGYKIINDVSFDKFSNNKQIDRILIEKLLKKNLDDQDQKLIKQYSAEFHQALDRVKICDPAIGSGAFPMGLLHEIFTAKQTLYTFEFGNTTNFDASGVKLNIIQNSIYGVDIERGAVDIARLRFWLSLIVDEPEPKALPNLDYKIVVGNSLVSKLGDDIIDIDWEMKGHKQINILYDVLKPEEILKQINQEQKEFFSPDSDKKKLAADIRNLKIDLLISQLELMVKSKGMETKPTSTGKTLTKQTEIYLQTIGWKNTITQLKNLKTKPELPLHFFDWKLDFPEVMNEQVVENVGFDIVIGNPPYFNIQTLGAKSSYVEQIKKKYSEIWMDKSDILFYFIKLGIDIAKPKGNICYIISNAFLFSDKAQCLRNFILEKAPIEQIINFEKYPVFESAMITTAIVSFKKDKTNTIAKALTLKDERKNNFTSIIQDKDNFINVNLRLDNVFALVNNETEKLNTKLDTNKTPLGQLVLIGKGMETAADNVFLFSEYPKQFDPKFVKKRVTGKNIQKYYINPNTDYVLYFEDIEELNLLPKSIQEYLFKNKSILENRATVKNEGRIWWRYSRPMHKEYYHLPKLFCSRRSFDNIFCYDSSFDYLSFSNMTVIFDNNPNLSIKYILALLNSKLLSFRYKSIGKQTGGGSFEYFPNGISKLPIAVISPSFQLTFIALVDKILTLKSEGKNTTILEQQIDNLVYKLYELTYEEVKIIDPEFALTEQEYDAIKMEY